MFMFRLVLFDDIMHKNTKQVTFNFYHDYCKLLLKIFTIKLVVTQTTFVSDPLRLKGVKLTL